MEGAIPLKVVKKSTAIVYIFFEISGSDEVIAIPMTNAQFATVLFVLLGWVSFGVSPTRSDEVSDDDRSHVGSEMFQLPRKGTTWNFFVNYSSVNGDVHQVKSDVIIACKSGGSGKASVQCSGSKAYVTLGDNLRFTTKRGVLLIEHAVGSYELSDAEIEKNYRDPQADEKTKTQIEKLFRENGL
ncbi:hypothetical protein LOC68_03225 [Blastopirellula sp. JC732]|uniref:Uncharacterized protein n=1 Tax=Blastopirellula sediminis TaxID=2894196 RepID=A0A9X1MK48_9BACT|nr:hypothetical protein [Blastopirellula sediminis]MCC9607810.1 hypothetical protein [Blastopirellula sediminis]MCC9627397.1 hypothetical protein [Blastopirellula sediminis]